MRRILLTLATAGSLTAGASNVPPGPPDQASVLTQVAVNDRVDDQRAQLGRNVIAAASATPASSKQALVDAEDDSNWSIYGALFSTLIVMVTIAFRRTRPRRS
jgi:hypothetical protein